MDYLAILDYEHMDNAFFLKSFADALGAHQHGRGLILHTDSEYTNRIMQSGMMREEAQIRSFKDLNHRLVALLADHGAPVIGINGYQRDTITVKNQKLTLNSDYLKKLPESVHLLLNPLVKNLDENRIELRPLPEIASCLITTFSVPEVYVFSARENEEIFTDKDTVVQQVRPNEPISDEISEMIPDDFKNMPFSYKILSVNDFRNMG